MTEYVSPTVGGGTVERVWTCIAASTADGEPLEGAVGRRTLERVAAFAYRHEAETWLAGQVFDGLTAGGIVPLATAYHGLTDSPSNCWSVRATKEYPAP